MSSVGESVNSRPAPGGLAKFITLHTVIIILAVFVLGGAFVTVTSMLESMVLLMNSEAERMTAVHELANELLFYRRDMLLAQVKADTLLATTALGHLVEVEKRIQTFPNQGLDRQEQQKLNEVLRRFGAFQELIRSQPAADPEKIRVLVDRVNEAVEIYRDFMRARLDATANECRSLNRDADRATWILVVALPLILAASGFALWRRIARPVFDLVVVADRFGAGDLGARAQVHRDDELGALTRTFNTMAEDIQARERERHDFMCSIVHDLSSPVAVISGAAQLLSRGLPPEKAQVWLERIATQAGRLASMNDDLLESARIGAGQLSIVLEDADLTSLVATSVAEQKLVHDKRVFTWSDPGPCRMLLDTKRIAQILANLITNAAKYSSAPTAIEVRLEASEQEATISIIDRGSGMSDEDILQLFKPFGRLARTERSVRGTGLGLYSVKKIIEAHGGTVSISSRLGEGTTVSIRLPRAYQSQGEGTQS